MEHAVRAESRKYHLIYKTTCIITNKWYIGLHSTNIVEDGYLGSGTRLSYSIRKYGRENHIREILEFCENREAVKQREKELVTSETIKLEKCLNLTVGGNAAPEVSGTTRERMRESAKTRKPISEEARKKLSDAMKKPGRADVWKDKKLSAEHRANISAGGKGRILSAEHKAKQSVAHSGKIHTEEHRKNNSKAQSKSYLVEYECGRTEIISNLMHWCLDRGIRNPELRFNSAIDKFYHGVKLRQLDGSIWTTKQKKRLDENGQHIIPGSKPLGKSYMIEYENGVKEIVTNLSSWSTDKNINGTQLRRKSSLNKFYEGVKLRNLDGSTYEFIKKKL